MPNIKKKNFNEKKECLNPIDICISTVEPRELNFKRAKKRNNKRKKNRNGNAVGLSIDLNLNNNNKHLVEINRPFKYVRTAIFASTQYCYYRFFQLFFLHLLITRKMILHIHFFFLHLLSFGLVRFYLSHRVV